MSVSRKVAESRHMQDPLTIRDPSLMPTSTARKPRTTRTPATVEVADVEVLDAPVEFSVTFQRDGDDEKHTFKARPELGYKRMKDVAVAQRTGGVNAILLFEKMIRPALLDTDGTPAKWEPEFENGKLIGPDGNLRDRRDVGAMQEFEAGSSRRRWLYLMDEDDDLNVELDEIASAYELLVEACSDRPTQRSSR